MPYVIPIRIILLPKCDWRINAVILTAKDRSCRVAILEENNTSFTDQMPKNMIVGSRDRIILGRKMKSRTATTSSHCWLPNQNQLVISQIHHVLFPNGWTATITIDIKNKKSKGVVIKINDYQVSTSQKARNRMPSQMVHPAPLPKLWQ